MKLIPVEETPFNAETPAEALAESMTPSPVFYVRNHYTVPAVEAGSWRLRVDGRVARPLVLSLTDLMRRSEHSVAVTLECAGNGRTLMTPQPPGTPWRYGAVGTAQFTGTSLRALLDEAGTQADTVEALFVGADEGPTTAGQSAPFMRSLPLEVARDPDTLVAWAMNGEPLSPDHGFPVRLVVPRWYGVASVKWLVRVSLLAQAFAGYYQRVKYVFAGDPDLPEGTPVTLMRVRAAVGRPLDGAVVPLGPVQVAGTAWSGYGAVTRVAISVDEGRSWSEAEVRRAPSPWSAASWRAVWVPERPGDYVLMARASDSAGHIQPLESVKNSHGYGNNVVQRVALSVRG